MLSHPLEEVRQIGEKIKMAAQNEVPTLVKYAEAVPYLNDTEREFTALGKACCAPTPPSGSGVKMLDHDPLAENKILAAALYRFSENSFSQALQYIESLNTEERAEIAEKLLGKLGKFDIPLRELEYSHYTFDLVMDQGAYYEFKRHRLMTQTPQNLSTNLGYATPALIQEADFESRYIEAMEAATESYQKLAAFDPHLAAYLVPNGFNRRVLATFNLRQAYHLCQLRAAKNAHFSIRRIARKIYAELESVHPLLTKYMRFPEEETWQEHLKS